MDIGTYISSLLYSKPFVVLPEFGAFVTNASGAASFADQSHLMPPHKSISFNPYLQENDGVLCKHIAQKEDKSLAEIEQKITELTKSWQSKLALGEKVQIEGLGVLEKSNDNIIVSSFAKQSLLKSSYGLGVVEIPATGAETPVAEEVNLDSRVENLGSYQLNEKIVAEKLDLVEEDSADVNPWFKYSALSLLFVSLAVSGYYFYNQYQKMLNAVDAEAYEINQNRIKAITYYSDTPLELPSIQINVVKRYNVIAGSYRTKEDAERLITALIDKGFASEYLTDENGADLGQTIHYATYKSFQSYAEAQDYLQEIKSSIEPNAWILVNQIKLSE
ncbi:MAG: hypothetical protein CMC19_06905 [Flavobacteriaceae bacterium]|nr:hypothetical protein [Flavobacteriaceae bacterium]OUX39636.1 MAG: hypothetical protein CBE25_03425 [Flavobacteriaceae bacterium TMED265]